MPAEDPAPGAIARELAQLAQSPIAVLRARWRGEFRTESPPAYGPDLLRRSLAYKLQEDAFGKLPASTRRELDRLAAQIERNPTARVQLSRRIKAGSVLVRDWQGKSHRVTVLARGFEYEERTYQSFSEIARLITGTRWNGPRFCRSGTRSTNRLWVDRGACLRRTRRGDLERGRLSSMPDRANGRALIQGCGMAGGGRRQPRRACVRRSLSAVWPDRTQLRNRDDQRVGSRPLAPADVAFLQQGICHIARSHREFWRALYRSVVIDLRRERRRRKNCRSTVVAKGMCRVRITTLGRLT